MEGAGHCGTFDPARVGPESVALPMYLTFLQARPGLLPHGHPSGVMAVHHLLKMCVLGGDEGTQLWAENTLRGASE